MSTRTRWQLANPTERLEAHVARYRTQREAAAALGITQPYLSDLLQGRRTFSDAILGKLGLRWAVVKEAR